MAPKILISLIATLVLANLVNSRVNAAPTGTEDSNKGNSEVFDDGEESQIESSNEQIENKSSVVGDSDAATTKSALEQTEEAKEIIAHRIDNTASVTAEDTQSKFNNRVDRKRRINNPAYEVRVMDENPEDIEAQFLSYDNSKGEDSDLENSGETQNETVTAKSKRGNKNVAKGQKKNGNGKTPAGKQLKRPNRTTKKFVLNGINLPSNNKGKGAKSKNGSRGKAKFGRKN